ncbi:MAG: hypothetical protein R2877_08370 [Bdellovibrionota bacterium]
MMNQTFKTISKGLDCLFPRVCFGCSQSHRPQRVPNLCILLGEISQPLRIKTTDRRVDILSAGLYQNLLKKIVTQAKFNRNSICTDFSLQLLVQTLGKNSAPFDLITSVQRITGDRYIVEATFQEPWPWNFRKRLGSIFERMF